MDRLASKLTHKEHLPLVYTLLYTLPGIPSIYYGSEWGIEGKKEGPNDDYLRPAVNLEEVLKEVPNPELMEWIQLLGKIHREYPACSNGEYKELVLANRQYAYARIQGDSGIIAAVNNDEQEAKIQIPAPFSEKTYRSLTDDEVWEPENGKILLTLKPSESKLLEFH